MSAEGWGGRATRADRRLHICADVWVLQGFFFSDGCSKPQASRICPLLTGPLGLLRECVRLQRFPLIPGWEDRFEMTSQGHLTRDLALASSSESPFLHNACRMITTNILWVIISKRYCTKHIFLGLPHLNYSLV